MTTLNQIHGTRFGSIDYCAEDVVFFPEGMIGFPGLTRFLILSHKPESPFRWLQSIDEPAIAFLVSEPSAYFEGYEPSMGANEAISLGLSEETPRLVFTTAAIPGGKVDGMTMNLAAPIVINLEQRIGKQMVLDDDRYSVRQPVFAVVRNAA